MPIPALPSYPQPPMYRQYIPPPYSYPQNPMYMAGMAGMGGMGYYAPVINPMA
jgi:hypothetical protein